MLLGVMAHEMATSPAGILASGAEKLKDAQIDTILTYVRRGGGSGQPENRKRRQR